MNLIRALLRSELFCIGNLYYLYRYCSTVFHYVSLPLRYYVAEGVRLYDLEGGHTDRGAQPAHQQIYK